MILRLRDSQTQGMLVVDTETKKVLQDRNGDDLIDATEKADDATASAALTAARALTELFVDPFPGSRAPDGRFASDGAVNAREAATLAAGGSIASTRTFLQHHVDFFDRNHDGWMSVRENHDGWKELGLGKVGASVKTAASAALFGKPGNGFAIDLERIGQKRYNNSTGIFDKHGNVDEAKLQSYLVEFDKRGGGKLTPKQVMELVKEHGKTGTVSKGQFKSFFTLCARINGEKVVTKEQFRAIFEGSFLYLAASMTDHEGNRNLRT
jgi:hypothetical protein